MLNAKVKRPEYDENLTDHPTVKLTATVSRGSVSKEFELNAKVKMLGITDSRAVILDLNAITLPSTTIEDIELPIIGKNGSTISWTSNNPDIMNSFGKISRPSVGEDEAEITLTATSSKGNETQTKDFTISIPAWTKEEELEQAYEMVTWDLIKGNNINSQSIDSDLVLPDTVGREVNLEWSLVSSTASSESTTGKLDITTGKIIRPTHTQGQVSIQISCKLSKNGETKTKDLPPFILSPAPMTDDEVLSAASTLLESSQFLGDNESLSKITTDMQLPYRLNDPDASRATISWSLVTHTKHEALTSSPYIALSNSAEYMIAAITRPLKSEGNVQVGLKALIKVDSDSSNKTAEKYFDMTILVEDDSANA